MSNVSVLEINESSVKFNLSFFRSKIKRNTKLLVVVKAFSYGSDSLLISTILEKENIAYLAVAYVQEGVYLRKNGVALPILVLHPQEQNLKLHLSYDLEPNLYTEKLLNSFITILIEEKYRNYPIHIKFNTGLNRLGFHPKDVKRIILIINKTKELRIASVFSHLVASEDVFEKEFTKGQISVFEKLKNTIDNLLDYNPLFHIVNTSGIINYPEAQFDMVRLGVGLYGFGNNLSITNQLQNVVSLKTVISQLHTLKPGDSVGYNRTFKVTQKTKIAIVPIGYADGVSRKLGNKKIEVLVNNQKAWIVGVICMDMLMIDVTKILCQEGDTVVIYNSQNMIQDICKKLDTIPYEILTNVSQRIKREMVF